MMVENIQLSINTPVLFKKVYFVENPDEKSSYPRHSDAPIAINPYINPTQKMAEWGTNSSRGDFIHWDRIGENIQQHLPANGSKDITEPTIIEGGPDVITFVENNHTLRLVTLTRAIFDQKVRPHVAGGKSLSFTTDEEVQKFFQEADFEPL